MIINPTPLLKKGIELHNPRPFPHWGNVYIEAPTFSSASLRFDTDLSIGAFCNINHNTEIGHTKIGRYTSIAQSCFIGADKHPTNRLSTSRLFYTPDFKGFPKHEGIDNFHHHPFHETGAITSIGNDVLIANSCIISRGVTIGSGAIIAPGSVVTKDVPPYAIVGGNPARILKYRFNEETIDALLKSQWWELSLKTLSAAPHSDIDRFIEEISKNKTSQNQFTPKFILSNENRMEFTSL